MIIAGYGKAPAIIAQGAIAKAVAEHYDVVLIDTAGRMQVGARRGIGGGGGGARSHGTRRIMSR